LVLLLVLAVAAQSDSNNLGWLPKSHARPPSTHPARNDYRRFTQVIAPFQKWKTLLHQVVKGPDLTAVGIVGLLLGMDPLAPQRLNTVSLRSGRMVGARQAGAMEALVSEGFAVARQLQPGDRLTALINGKREDLLIVGIALSPE
jgi:hypothetical protein